MNDPSLLNRNYGLWQPTNPPPVQQQPVPLTGEEQMAAVAFQNPGRPAFQLGVGGKHGRMNWKGKKAAEKRMMIGGTVPSGPPGGGAGAGSSSGGGGSGYMPPALHELQHQNRVKARRFYSKKKSQQQQHVGGGRFKPYAPRNTTSFIIRAKKAGGIASLVSPCPVTPAVLPTPKFSPSRERVVDMAKEEWGVDGYGSMKGLIRLRSPTSSHGGGAGGIGAGDDDEDVEDGSSESDVEEHVEVERRLDHDLSRFEMVYNPNFLEDGGIGFAAAGPSYVLENRVDDQDAHIAQLEEENLTLKERLFLMEREMDDMRRRLQVLETDCIRAREENQANATEEVSDNENEEGGDVCSEKSAGD